MRMPWHLLLEEIPGAHKGGLAGRIAVKAEGDRSVRECAESVEVSAGQCSTACGKWNERQCGLSHFEDGPPVKGTLDDDRPCAIAKLLC